MRGIESAIATAFIRPRALSTAARMRILPGSSPLCFSSASMSDAVSWIS